MKQLIIILVVLAVALFIVVGCKGKKVVGVNREWSNVDSAIREDSFIVGSEWWDDSSLRIDKIIISNDTFPFLHSLKDTTFKLSKMRTFEYFIGEMGNMAARKHLNGEWEIFDCAKALDIVVKTNKQAADEIEKLETQLDGFRSAYKHDDIRPMVGVDRLQPGKEGVVRAVVKGTLGWVYTFETIN